MRLVGIMRGLFAFLALLAGCGGSTDNGTAAGDSGTGITSASSTGGRSYVPFPAAGGRTLSGNDGGNSGIDGSNQSQGGRNTFTFGGATGGAATGGSMSTGGAITGGYAGTGGTLPLRCGVDACVSANAKCGSVIDDCGVAQDCGTCAAGATCGAMIPNQCYSCDMPISTCPANANCGTVCDGCGGLLNCGTCSGTDQCVSNVCTPAMQTCIAGSLGCLCDSTGACAPGLTCTAQTWSGVIYNVCCDSTGNCTGSATSIGSNCAGTDPASCTPGITIPAATAMTDNCGYPKTSFNGSATLCGINATGGGNSPVQIQAYVNDQSPLTLGCATSTYPVSAMTTTNLGAVYYPQLGDPACNDTSGRPVRPTLFITDITADSNCKSGDQQAGGTAYDPIAVFGTWVAANANGTPPTATFPMNYWTLGTGSDPIPASVSNQCPCTAQSCPGSGLTGRGYGSEVLYEAGLISGHSYRLQIMGHDGDPSQGGNAGEACVIFCAGPPAGCRPLTCADYPAGTSGPQPDGCGGLIDCGCAPTGTCIPKTCEDNCPVDANGKHTCSSAYNLLDGFTVQCAKSTGCANPSVEQCWCVIQ